MDISNKSGGGGAWSPAVSHWYDFNPEVSYKDKRERVITARWLPGL